MANINVSDLINSYLNDKTWEVKESASQGFSAQGLNGFLSNSLIKKYWLREIYDNEILKCYNENRFHIHDLGSLTTYCCGWSLEDILLRGYESANGNIKSKPAKHFFILLNQIVNFMYTLQGEAAGAQALSNFDTLCAPFIKIEKLTYTEVKKYMQSFIFHMNVPTRVGFQAPFTNLSFDIVCPENMRDKLVIYDGKYQEDIYYKDCQKEMDMINQAFCEVMIAGDANNSIFSFPIPTYNLSNDFDFNDPKYEKIWEMTAKYGIPYFTNFINSNLNPSDFRSMCPLSYDTKLTLRIYDQLIENTFEYWFNYQETHSDCLEVLTPTGYEKCKINKQFSQYINIVTLSNEEIIKFGMMHLQPVIYNNKHYTIKACDIKVGMLIPFDKSKVFNVNPDYIDDKYNYYRVIKTLLVPNYHNVYCLEVKNKDHLFYISNGMLTHNCRLRLDVKSIQKRNGGLFGATPLTGSVGVVTLNLPNLAYRSRSKEEFIKELDYTIKIAVRSLKKKREVIEKLTENNFYPYSKIYLSDIKKRFGSYWNNHFSTIGLIGMNEAITILYPNENIITRKDFAETVLNHIKDELMKYQQEDKTLYNLEATPAESTSYRLAQKDNEIFGKNIGYYTNSSTIPVDIDTGLINNIKHQESLQNIYTGGTVFHIFLGEQINSNQARDLIKLIATNYKIPYITLTPTFSICPVHKYLPGAHEICTHSDCNEKCNIYSRIVGYYRPVNNWNKGKQMEFNNRLMFDYDYSRFKGDIELITEAESIKDFIYDYNQTSTINWKDHISTVIYTSGCNLKCPWCYNYEINTIKKKSPISLIKFISESMDDIVITGGEPTIQKDLIRVLRIFKKLGFHVKLDTNGTNPDVIEEIIKEELVDSISMDIKATKDKYYSATGEVMNNVYDKVMKTKQIIDNSGINHEYRTTLIKELTDKDIKDIEDLVKPEILTKQNEI